MEEEVGEYEIDYTKVYKPTIVTRRRQRNIEEEREVDKDYEQQFSARYI
jgi:hypothetical protein